MLFFFPLSLQTLLVFSTREQLNQWADTMVDNRYATALVIGSVLSLLATVYLSVAVGTQHWYEYSMPPGAHDGSNASLSIDDSVDGDLDEKAAGETSYHRNGTMGLWWWCIIKVPSQSYSFKEPGSTH